MARDAALSAPLYRHILFTDRNYYHRVHRPQRYTISTAKSL